MKAVVELLNAMKADGLIKDYALFGAMAQMRYTEPVATMDVDVLVFMDSTASLDLLRPLYQFCQAHGFHPQGEAVQVGDWPVQFIPTFSPLTEEAVREAETGEIDGLPVRVAGAKYLAALALSVGRAKDYTRILALLESGAVQCQEIASLAMRHGLEQAWNTFKQKFLNE